MENKNIIIDKSYGFAIKSIGLYKNLSTVKKEYVLSKQLLRSGTSIGANIREAHNAQSKADFVHKLAISQKECDESLYWLELLHETDYLDQIKFKELHNDGTEILRILRSIILTTKQKMGK